MPGGSSLVAPILGPLVISNGVLIVNATSAGGGDNNYTYELNIGTTSMGESDTGLGSIVPAFAYPVSSLSTGANYVTITASNVGLGSFSPATSNEQMINVESLAPPSWIGPLSIILPDSQTQFSLGVGDQLPVLNFRIVDATGADIDVSQVESFNFTMNDAQANSIASGSLNQTGTTYTYDWQSGDTASAGTYYARAILTYNDGKLASVPDNGALTVNVSTE